ncbi:MAG: phosphotransferase [Proteobacteria bacterium]|nr:phosphotransferase [Pseudomonadota bacterium]
MPMNADDRTAARQEFVRRHFPQAQTRIDAASADASFRSYWRVRAGDDARIVMDAPPDKEDIAPWLDIATRLHGAGVHAPQVFAADPANGFVLMEDLGDRTYLPELNESSVDGLYADALGALARMQAIDTTGLPHYDRARLIAEMELLPEWFLKRHLGFTPSCDEWDVIEGAFTHLVHAALEQPRVFVHRDYHSRNLLVTATMSPGVIDFQDAVAGPIAYDLVSLLRDCYIAWPDARVEAWVEAYRRRAATDIDAATFRRWFDLIGLQRHIKVLGIFCRLWYRDGKAQYLRDLPLVWQYFTRVARRYPELVDFSTLLQRAVAGRDLTVPAQ